jgi:hypothetical protein
MESRGTDNSANTEIHVTEKLVNEDSQVTQHSGNAKHWVRQNSESKNLGVRKDVTLS